MTDLQAANKAEAARLANSQAASADVNARQYREQRDQLIIALNSIDGWSYGTIAKEVGLSKGMVATICRPVRGMRT